ncbi:hypothetical protein [Corynebacterium oculi]|uniref:Uncharacterized protein n=1 Tax=Corynebacterium oculi TaxID=1544416 RepID=A0A0Q0YB56_9CORY|nr:hypothetical protein [Corynebacterium oculi]KQB83097.1 hypothetical protein Cocul_02069 [Corynebacterium oculi]
MDASQVASESDIILAPGEKGLYARKFRPTLTLFWLRTTMVVTNKRILIRYPNTVFGIIPLGFEEMAMPVGSVAGVTTSQKVKFGQLLFSGLLALVFVLVGFGQIAGNVGLGFILILLGGFFTASALNAISSSFAVTNSGGGRNECTVSILDKDKLTQFKNKVNEIIYSASSGGTSWAEV